MPKNSRIAGVSAGAFVLPNNISGWAGGGDGTGLRRQRRLLQRTPVKQAAGRTVGRPVVDAEAAEARAWSTFEDDSNYER